MIVGIDLDDTLYRELDYVESGFRAVAAHLEGTDGVGADESYQAMLDSLRQHGRGHQFDHLLERHGLNTARRRRELLSAYRLHEPTLSLPSASAAAIDRLISAGHRLFLVTDGNSTVQARKVSALGLWDRFEHCYLTARYGRDATKPSTRVFDLMLRRTGAEPGALVYAGDNPAKDFVGVRSIGGHTIRCHTGPYARLTAAPGHDAEHHIDSISELPDIVESIAHGR